jgi:hypothetical protein
MGRPKLKPEPLFALLEAFHLCGELAAVLVRHGVLPALRLLDHVENAHILQSAFRFVFYAKLIFFRY